MRYKEYKKVDIPWLDEVPSHWEVKRIASIFDIRKEKNDPIKTEEVLSLSAKYGVTPYSEKKEKGGNKPKSDLTKYNLCYQGDILVNCMNIVAGAVGISNYFGAVSPVYYPLVTNKYNNKYYMEYLFRNYDFQRGMVGLGKGIMMNESESGNLTTVRMRISWDTLKTLEIPVPSKEEQEQMARFLDWKINEIDGIIKSKNKMLNKIIFMKKSFITKMITKGYSNIDVMPDSINIVRLKNLCNKIIDGTHFTPEYQKDGIPFLRVTDISQLKYNEDIDLSKVKRISKEEHYILTKRCNPKKGDVLISKNGSIGIPMIVNWDWDFSIFVSLCLLKLTNEVIPEWVYFYFLSSLVEIEIAKGGKKGTIVNLHLEKIKEFQIPLPSLEEQKEIVDIINKKIIKLDELKSNIEKQINNLQQLKQSLISDVVTGKIDVRNVSIPEYNKVIDMEDDINLEESFNEEV